MMLTLLLLAVLVPSFTLGGNYLPQGFAYLSEVDPTIIEEMRYFTFHNFVGRPIGGYYAGKCILTLRAAYQLK